MKTLVVYYSLGGNTELVAENIKSIIGADLLELKPEKPYPTGRISKFLAGKAALAHDRPKLLPYKFDVDKYDRIVIGTPVWAGYPAPPINTFLAENDLSGKRLCFYASSLSGDGEKCLRYMKDMAGAPDDCPTLSVKEPKNKPTDKTMQSIQHWGIEIIGTFDSNEVWDLYDEDRNPTGETMKRGTPIPQGAYHIVISIWLRNSQGQFLMSRRSEEKEWSPGIWETTGGAVVAGETSIQGAVREVREELGIRLDPEKGRLVRSLRSDTMQDFYDAWMFDVDVDIDDIKMQEHEVTQVKWMDPDEIDRLWQDKKLHLLLHYYKDIM